MCKLLRIGLLGLWCLVAVPAWAMEPFTVQDIRLEGLQRIAAGTVFNYLPVKVGETMDDTHASEAIRALFQTGFFSDVRLEREGDVLVVFVTERPAISSIKITGNKDIDTDQLIKALKEQGLGDGLTFDRALLDRAEQELRRQYFSRGKYGVEISATATPLERNRVGIAIDISEGRAARIREINIIGNDTFDDEDLLADFQSGITGTFSFYTGDDQYSKQKLSADLETLRSFYLDRGYINFSISSTQVSITPDKKDIYITINVVEGDKFTVKDVKLAGDLVLSEAELGALVTVKPGEIFSRKSATDTTTKLIERLGDEGYAFANVNAIPEIDQTDRQVGLTFFVDPGKRVYVRRINVAGNTKTRDEVLRREMRQLESAWISTEKVKRSRVRLDKLSYFEEVNVETPAVPGTTDQVDVNFTVVEKPSGNLLAGLGFSQSQGIIFNTSIKQDNFLGSGKHVSAAFNNSRVNTVYSFAYTNPYHTPDGISRGFSLFYRTTDASNANISNYSTDVQGAFVNYGIPLNEYDSVRLSAGYEGTSIQTGTQTPTEYTDFLDAAGREEFATIKLTGGWSHDTRNRAVFADEGMFQNLSAEVTAPGTNLEFYKVRYRHLLLYPLAKYWTLSLNGDVGYGKSFGDTPELPFFENFFAGGSRSVRGFKDNTLGPRGSNDRPLGGNLKVVGNAEVFFPVPFVRDSKSVRLSFFVDIGNVYGDEGFEASELRYSSGLSAVWLSPLGPLTVSVAKPLNSGPEDDEQSFQFTLGSLF